VLRNGRKNIDTISIDMKILEFHQDGIYFHEFLSVENVPEGLYSSVASNILIDFLGVCWSKRVYVGS
jgi:hypothetical protein